MLCFLCISFLFRSPIVQICCQFLHVLLLRLMRTPVITLARTTYSLTARYRAVDANMYPLCESDGKAIMTVEALGDYKNLHKIQVCIHECTCGCQSITSGANAQYDVDVDMRTCSSSLVTPAAVPFLFGDRSWNSFLLVVSHATSPTPSLVLPPLIMLRLFMRSQETFVDMFAMQSGYDSAGFMMAFCALMLNNPSPSPIEVEKAFDGTHSIISHRTPPTAPTPSHRTAC